MLDSLAFNTFGEGICCAGGKQGYWSLRIAALFSGCCPLLEVVPLGHMIDISGT